MKNYIDSFISNWTREQKKEININRLECKKKIGFIPLLTVHGILFVQCDFFLWIVKNGWHAQSWEMASFFLFFVLVSLFCHLDISKNAFHSKFNGATK